MSTTAKEKDEKEPQTFEPNQILLLLVDFPGAEIVAPIVSSN